MGLAIDTVLVDVHNATTNAVTLTNATVTNSGDSLSIRSFDTGAWAKLESIFLQGSSTEQARILSPRLHDNVTGLTFETPETPSEFLFPQEVGEPMYSSDTLTVQLSAAASSDSVAALLMYYSNIDGVSANLATWAQVKAAMIHLKTVEVAVTSSPTIGTWTDTVITTTENQLKADYTYALLGFETTAPLCAMGIKGPATGNLRICAPGATSTLDITRYFVELGNHQNTPHIPVFKANDRGATNISVAANTASVSAHVYAYLAQLSS
jgi:hypothetical protein